MFPKTIEEMQMAALLSSKKKKELKKKTIKKNDGEDEATNEEKSQFKINKTDSVSKDRKKEISDASTFSNIAVKINVSINDLKEISKLPEGGHNTAELAKDLKHNKGEGIKQKIKNLHEGKEELKETFVNQLHLKSHHVTGSFVKDLQERGNGPKDHDH